MIEINVRLNLPCLLKMAGLDKEGKLSDTNILVLQTYLRSIREKKELSLLIINIEKTDEQDVMLLKIRPHIKFMGGQTFHLQQYQEDVSIFLWVIDSCIVKD